MDNMHSEEFAPIDIIAGLRLFWRHFLRLWWIPVVLALALGTCAYFRSVNSYRPQYQTSAILSVSTGIEDGSYSFYADSGAMESVVETFSYLLNSEVMRERLRQTLDGSMGGSVRAEFVPGTSLFSLIATSPDPQKAVNLIEAVIAVYPQVSAPILGNTYLKIIESAQLPTEPYNSPAGFSAAASAAVKGILFGIALIAVYALTRSTATSSDDVKKMINLECLAKVPQVTRKARKSRKQRGLLITRDDYPGFQEAFHLLRTRLTRRLGEDEKIILFTSSVPSEGKSSIAANTALSLAREGRQVLLVDADLRHPSVKPLLGIRDKTTGLGEYLSGITTNIEFTHIEGTSLYVYAGDTPFENPATLFRHNRIESLMKVLRSSFDYIIVDTPPASMMADASALCCHADKVVYVIREDYATKHQIRSGTQAISSRAKLCGFVLNMTSGESSGSYGYGYGYGYSQSKKRTDGRK